ncbi:MAG: putative quinol monooxygenase [Thermoanaerobaculia bacterium]
MATQQDLAVTGRLDTTGGVLDSGEVRVDAQGRLLIRNRVVWGSFLLTVGGVPIAGRSVMSASGQLDADDNGALFGTVALLAETGDGPVLLWEGHWAGMCARGAISSGLLVGWGRNRFSGQSLRLSLTEAGTTGGRQIGLTGATGEGSEHGISGLVSSGVVVAPGETHTDAQNNLRMRNQRVAGTLLLNLDGMEIHGRQILEVNANLNGEETGPVYGSFTWTQGAAGEEITIFEGHWAGHLERRVGVGTMVACGRGPFLGYKLYAHRQEIPADVTPDSHVAVLDGYAILEDAVGVTGISNSLGGILEPGRTYTDERGRTNIRDMVVIGDLDLRVGATRLTGKQIFRVNAVVDPKNNGIDYGSFLLNSDGGEALWQGHWAGRSVERVGRSSEMLGLGRGPFAGQRIYLKMVEIAGFAGNPDPSIYILVGEANAAVGIGVTGFARVDGGLAHLGGPARDAVGRWLVQRRVVEGESWLLLGDTEVEGRQVLELDGALDDRQTGPLRGRFRLTEAPDAILGEGEWSGRLKKSMAAAVMTGTGRNQLSGRRIVLSAREPEDPPEILWGTPEGSLRGIRPQAAGDVEDLCVLLLSGHLDRRDEVTTESVAGQPVGGASSHSASPTDMVILVRFTVKSRRHVKRFREICSEDLQNFQMKSEPAGLLAFTVYQDPKDERRFYYSQRWRSAEAQRLATQTYVNFKETNEITLPEVMVLHPGQ